MLRKAGFRTVRISVGLTGWQPENAVFGRHVSLTSPPSPEQLAEILSNEYVADIQPIERLAATTYAALDLLPSSQRSDMWIGRSAFLDKWDVAQILRDIGVHAPDTLLASVTSSFEAVEELSTPIVLKKRVGSSGSGVEVFSTLDSLEEFVAGIDHLDEWFYERYVQGRSLACAIVARDDGIDVIAIYEILKRLNVRGPSVAVKFQDDELMAEYATALSDAMHVRGFVCFDFIQDSGGVNWIHDVNLRVFATFSICQMVGVDFFGAYIRCLTGDGEIAPAHHDTSGTEAVAFPSGLRDVSRLGRRWTAWLRTVHWIWRYERLLGPRYIVSWIIGSIASASRSARRAVQR
jgi:hypothetical protein